MKPSPGNSKLFFCLLVLCLVFVSAKAIAQNSPGANNTVAVVPFSTSFAQDEDEADFSKMLTETVLSSIVQTQRFIMVDITDLEKAVLVMDRQQNSEDFEGWEKVSEAHLVAAGKKLGIEYIYTGNITNVSHSPSVSGLWRAEFGFTIKAISVESGRIYVTESFSVNSDKGIGGRLGGKDSKQEAFNAALGNVGEPVKKFIDRYFPVEVKLFKVKETDPKKGFPRVVVISGGISIGLRKEQELNVSLKEISDDGSIYRDKIGEIRIIEIEANFATCKVLKGAEDIHKALAENKDKIFVQSRTYD